MKLYMFRTVPLSISFTVNSAMVYVIQVCRQLSSRIRMEQEFHSDPAAAEFHFQNKFEKLVHLVGFIIRKFVMMHGHMNGKKSKRHVLKY
jgi:hypothetical protein